MSISVRANEDILSAQVSSTGELVGSPARVRGVWLAAAAEAGSVVLRNDGASGTVVLTLDSPAAVGGHYVEFPGGGLVFDDDVHATLTNVTAVTAFYSLVV